MMYTIKIPSWTKGAFSNAWDAMVDSDQFMEGSMDPEVYFKNRLNIELFSNQSSNFDRARFQSKESYILFLLEWS
jgi:hypothetical protein